MHFNDLTTEQLGKALNMLKAIENPVWIAILNYPEDVKKLMVTEIHELIKIVQSTTLGHLGIIKDKGMLS